MSHLECPLCGKNAPISSFDPCSLDLDLRLVSFRGLGRGKGFEVSDEYSVLGDDVYSPQVAERSLDLCRMFLDNRVIDSEQTMRKLGMDSTIKKFSELPKLTQPQATDARSVSSSAQMGQARETIEQQRKELALVRMIDRELVRFVKYYPHVKIYEGELPWSIEITDIDEECLPFLFALFNKFNYHERKTLLKRVNTNHPMVQKSLEELTIRKKTISERLVEFNFDLSLDRSDLRIQEGVSKKPSTSEPTIQETSGKPNKRHEKSIAKRLLELDLS